MSEQESKNMIVPIEVEIDRLNRLISEKEKRTNPRLMKKMGKLKTKLAQLREMLAPNRAKLAGAY